MNSVVQIAEEQLLLGDNLLPWLLFAFGCAMVVGNLAAYLRPPQPKPGDSTEIRQRPTLSRTMLFVIIGSLSAVWAMASLLKS